VAQAAQIAAFVVSEEKEWNTICTVVDDEYRMMYGTVDDLCI
jgi:hypothetical protein